MFELLPLWTEDTVGKSTWGATAHITETQNKQTKTQLFKWNMNNSTEINSYYDFKTYFNTITMTMWHRHAVCTNALFKAFLKAFLDGEWDWIEITQTVTTNNLDKHILNSSATCQWNKNAIMCILLQKYPYLHFIFPIIC